MKDQPLSLRCLYPVLAINFNVGATRLHQLTILFTQFDRVALDSIFGVYPAILWVNIMGARHAPLRFLVMS